MQHEHQRTKHPLTRQPSIDKVRILIVTTINCDTRYRWDSAVSDFLQAEYYDEWHHLHISEEMASPQDGFQTVKGNNKAVTASYLWEMWCQGKGRGIFQEKGKPPTGIWAYNRDERNALKDQWNAEWASEFQRTLSNLMEELTKNAENLSRLRMSSDKRVTSLVRVLRHIRLRGGACLRCFRFIRVDESQSTVITTSPPFSYKRVGNNQLLWSAAADGDGVHHWEHHCGSGKGEEHASRGGACRGAGGRGRRDFRVTGETWRTTNVKPAVD
eukprot:4907736-Pyramimonas_sp.AAC.3